MPDDLPTIRARARAHQAELDARATFYTVQDLAARWGCAAASVRNIPAARLPFTVVGRGATRAHRRYNPADVEAYEHGEHARGRRGAA